MCISAEADLVTGVVIGAVAVDALRHARARGETLLAAIPLVLAVHQLIEVPVWWGLERAVEEAVWRPAAWLYLAIAFGVVPVLVPVAVTAAEPPADRSRIRPFAVLGVAVAAVLMYAVVRGPVDATLDERRIGYAVDLWQGGALVTLYVVATCGSLLASSDRHVRLFGVLNLVAAGVLSWADAFGFTSLWCFWAAVTSVAIAAHIRAAHRPPGRGLVSATP